jgi:F-type H+-transporting ATPase subunit b
MAERTTMPTTGETTDAAKELHTTVVGDEGHAPTPHADPSALGLDATMWVALAMLVVIALAIWKKVPAMVAGMLDKRIAEIRKQLDEAKQLRTEAEALKAEYEGKAAAANADADAMRAHAHVEAEAILAKAEADATALIGRRQAMAEDRIAAAERTAIAQVRAKTASAAASAAASLIAANHNAASDKPLVDSAIARLN